MKRRTLDIAFSVGGLILALLLLAIGLVLHSEYNWGRDYVREELGAQRIIFPTEERLTEEEKTWKSGSSCLVKYAGETMDSGSQAECYARYFIALHVEQSAIRAGYPGETYATLGPIRTALTAEIQEAEDAGDEEAAEAARERLQAATSLRSTMQTGETLRGLLLTSYGFSVLADRALLIAQISYGIAAILVILSIAGFVHAYFARDERVFKE